MFPPYVINWRQTSSAPNIIQHGQDFELWELVLTLKWSNNPSVRKFALLNTVLNVVDLNAPSVVDYHRSFFFFFIVWNSLRLLPSLTATIKCFRSVSLTKLLITGTLTWGVSWTYGRRIWRVRSKKLRLGGGPTRLIDFKTKLEAWLHASRLYKYV